MKLTYFLIFLLPLLGYSQITVSGKVSDENNLPISFADIIIKQDSLAVNQAITDSLGNYLLNIKKEGNYNFTYRGISTSTQNIALIIRKDTIINVKLENSINELVEIAISSKRKIIERKSDRYVLNVGNSVTAMGSDAFTLISRTPGVRTSSTQINLVGKSDVIVTIDDKVVQLNGEDLISYLKTIPSSEISKIEVITNPSSKYEAQGSSGILNIIMKKNLKEGYSGTVNVDYKRHKYDNFGGNTNLTFNKGKWKINTNLAAGSVKDSEIHSIDTYYPFQTWFLNGKAGSKDTNFNANADIQYLLSDKTQINLSLLSANKQSKKTNDYKIDIFDTAHNLDSINRTESDINRKNRQSAVNLQLKHNFDGEGKTLTVETEWMGRFEDSKQHLFGQNFDSQGVELPDSAFKIKSENTSDIDIFTVNGGLNIPLEHYELSVGSKITFINLQTESNLFTGVNDDYTLDNAQSPDSDYNENRQAVYTDLKRSFDKWKFQLGLRFEYTQIDGTSKAIVQDSFKDNYFQVFPSLNVTFTPNETNSFDLTYGKRINRPVFRLLNPFRLYTSAYDYWQGNPFLKPSITNNVDVSYSYKSVFTSTFSYSNTKNNFEQITIFQPNNVISHLALNYMNSNTYQLMFTTSVNKLKWMESNLQLQGFYKEFITKINTVNDNHIWGWYFMVNNQFQFNKSKTIAGEMNFWYQSKSIDLEAVYKRQFNMDLGLKFQLFQKKLNVGLNVSDLLQSNKEKFVTSVNNIRQDFYNYWEPRSFRISLQYKFGNKKVSYSEREQSNTEDRNR
ncbi:TonB-dependent receptor domain-containing protein [Flavobacterium sp.]|uniref:TonB-dependent receptor domain-containing protein n=1 Tax=Flavobacterium sp. TaxID=239 RepID=UPI003D6B652B